MFGIGKKRIPTGAREKVEMAKQMRKAGRYDTDMPGKGADAKYPSQVIPLTIFYAIAIILATVLANNSNNPLAGMHLTGVSSIDNIVTGTGNAGLVSDPDEDQVLTIFARGTAFFLMAGIVPLISYALERLFMRGKVTPFLICWGVTTLLMLLYMCWDSVASFVKIFKFT